MNSSTNQPVHSFSKNETERVQFALKNYKGKRYLDLRIWFQDPQNRSFHPTKKGICLPLEHLGDLKKGLDEIRRSLLESQNSPTAKLNESQHLSGIQ